MITRIYIILENRTIFNAYDVYTETKMGNLTYLETTHRTIEQIKELYAACHPNDEVIVWEYKLR